MRVKEWRLKLISDGPHPKYITFLVRSVVYPPQGISW